MYHIQTEDNGLRNPIIITLLYHKGTILASKKVSYAEFTSDPDCKEKVRKLMKEQHKTMMKELIRGNYTADLDDTDKKADTEKNKTESLVQENQGAPEGQITGGPDEVLLDNTIRGGE
jgi:hypothetical protein